MESLNERISKVIEYSTLTSSEFADEIEVQRSSVSHITSKRNRPSLDFLIKIKTKYPELSWDWLIQGKGEMIEKPKNKTKANASALPDLFSIIEDDSFGRSESKMNLENPIQNYNERESPIVIQSQEKNYTNDSQQLEKNSSFKTNNSPSKEEQKVKKIILLYENGQFELFEP